MWRRCAALILLISLMLVSVPAYASIGVGLHRSGDTSIRDPTPTTDRSMKTTLTAQDPDINSTTRRERPRLRVVVG